MSQTPYMPVFTDALIGDTTHLTTEEFGAYCLILFATWANRGKPFADDDNRMARVARCNVFRWRKVIRPALVSFFDLSDKTWRQNRLEKEWRFVDEKRAKRSVASQARWLKTNKPDDANGHPSGYANGYPPIPIYTEEDKSSSDADASSKHDPVKEIFDRGVAILGSNRRGLLGKMAKQYGQVAVLAAIIATEQASPIDPVSYFVKACEQRQTNGHSQKHGPLTTLWEGAYHAALKWEETHGDSEDRSLAHVPLLDQRRVDGTA